MRITSQWRHVIGSCFLQTMKRNVDRVSVFVQAALENHRFVQSCFEWESKPRTIIAFTVKPSITSKFSFIVQLVYNFSDFFAVFRFIWQLFTVLSFTCFHWLCFSSSSRTSSSSTSPETHKRILLMTSVYVPNTRAIFIIHCYIFFYSKMISK